MKRYFPLFIAAICFFAAACKSSNKSADLTDTSTRKSADAVKTDSEKGSTTAGTDEYTLNVPEGWTQAEREFKGYKMLFLGAPKEDDFQPNLTVLKDDMHGKTIDEYIGFNLKQMEPMHIQLNKTAELDIDGIKGKFMTYTYNYQGRDIAIKSYILPKNNVAYVLTGSSLVSQSDKMMPFFDQAANSFRLK